MDQTKIYAIIVTAVLLLGGPAGYFFTTHDMTLEIQEKDGKIEKALDTLKKAKGAIKKKDLTIETQSGAIKVCNDKLTEKDGEILAMKDDLENAYAGISDDIISTESEFVLDKKKERESNLSIENTGTGSSVENLEDNKLTSKESIGETLIKEKSEKVDENEKTVESKIVAEKCEVCEKCNNKSNTIVKSGGNFDEKIELETMDLAYTKGYGTSGLPYVRVESESLLDMYNSDDSTLKAKIGYYCADDYLELDYYGSKEKLLVRSYERAYCKDEKYENCSSDVKKKIDVLKDSKNILGSNTVRILTKYNPENNGNIKQEVFAVYNDFGVRVCSWKVETSTSGKKSYLQIR